MPDTQKELNKWIDDGCMDGELVVRGWMGGYIDEWWVDG